MDNFREHLEDLKVLKVIFHVVSMWYLYVQMAKT